MRNCRGWFVLAAAAAALVACDDGGSDEGPAEDVVEDTALDVVDDTVEDATPDTVEDVAPDTVEDVADAGPDVEADGDAGDDAEVEQPLPELELFPTIAGPPADPLAEDEHTSCPVYREERCVEGTAQRCAIYDPAAGEFVAEPDPLLERVFLYDRWYDLHSSPDDQTAERVFNKPMPGDTPEEEWSDPANFSHYAGKGDASIWTGAALSSDIFRYVATGTEADYQRMEETTRTLVRAFDVTGIPGYLARHHFLLLPEGSPQSDEHMIYFGDPEDPDLHARHNPIEDPESVEGLPDAYFDGIPDGEGGLVQGTPMWNGHPSIDQYTGPMMTFPLVYPLLRDEDLAARMVEHMTCYLKRLRRLEIINIQDNPDVTDALTSYFGGSGLKLDPDDIDLRKQDRLVLYYNAGINRNNAEEFDRSCPDTVQLEPDVVIDAAADDFLLQMLDFANGLKDGSSDMPENQVDHFYAPNIRGGDASHMIHLAAMAYWFTGDEQYREFLFEELIGNLRADEVALTMQAFRLPDFCFKYYGDHITYGTHWQLITMLGDSPLRDTMIRAMEEEMWQKALHDHHSAKFNVMYAATVPEDVATGHGAAVEMAVLALEDFGGNDGVKNAPRRTYDLSRQTVIDGFPEGTTVRCPTAEER
ncbi:MAG: hypothetical protein ACQEXJ_24085, partial [Myxococcota bacterium]